MGAGMSARQIEYKVTSSSWLRVFPGVFQVATSVSTWRQAMLAAWLWAGPSAAVSHRAAAKWLDLMGSDVSPFELTLPFSKKASSGDVVLHASRIRAGIVRRDGLFVTDPTRTLVELGAVVAPERLEVALEDAIRQGLTTMSRIQKWADLYGGRGRPGTGVLAEILRSRKGGPAESMLEVKVIRAMREARLPIPVRQYRIATSSGTYRVDLAFPEKMLVIECDSLTHHWSPRHMKADIARRNALEALGWRVIHITWSDVVDRKDETMALVALALAPAGPSSRD